MSEQWYYCDTDLFAFPASEISGHRGHKIREIDAQTEEDDSWEDE